MWRVGEATSSDGSLNHAGFRCCNFDMLGPEWSAPLRESLDPAGAGAVLLGTTVAGIGIGALVGWVASAWPIRPSSARSSGTSPQGSSPSAAATTRGVLVRDVWATPRPIPNRLVPVAGGAAVVALALLVVARRLAARGWALGAILWLCAQALGLLLCACSSAPIISPPRV